MRIGTSAIVIFAMSAIACLPASAVAVDAPDVLKKVGFDQRLNQQVPLDLQFTDETGKSVKLRDYFGEKPVILVLAYYKCPMLCTLVLNGLTRGMREIPFTIGKEFNVVVVSFNPHETPDLAAKKKDTYLTSYGRPGGDWHFLTGKQDEITKLTEAVGFRYQYDAKTDQYIHASGIMIFDSQRQDFAILLWHRLSCSRPAARVGRGIGRKDRFADRPGIAILFPLRSDHWQVHGQRDELHTCGQHGDDGGAGVHDTRNAQDRGPKTAPSGE